MYARLLKALWFALLIAATPALAQPAPPVASAPNAKIDTGAYEPVVGWFKPGIDRFDQRVVSVVADNPNRIIIGMNDRTLTAAGFPLLTADGKVMAEKTTVPTEKDPAKIDVNQLLVLNGDGKMIENWSQWNALIGIPHSLAISPYDRERHIWVVDRTGQQILKLTNDGKKLVMKVGEQNVAGTDHNHFNEPAGITFMPDGSFYIADGYKNGRIIKFDKDGKFLLEFGTKGSGPGQFNLVHSVALDAQHRAYTADRVNNRIEVFDGDTGKFIEEWPNLGSVTVIRVTDDNALWVSLAGVNQFAKYDLHGKRLMAWGGQGMMPGQIDNPHQWATDQAGNLYVADSNNDRVQKFVPKKGADKSQLIGPELTKK
ncbi:MAG: 6-bladed beta-propeller [Reyranella sp.]